MTILFRTFWAIVFSFPASITIAQSTTAHVSRYANDNADSLQSFCFGRFQITPICSGFISTRRVNGWAQPEPVYSWLICTSTDTILIDAGMNKHVSSGSFFPYYMRPLIRLKYRFALTDIDSLLRQKGIDQRSVKYILLTHAHFDHIGYLDCFPTSKIVMSQKEYHDAASSFCFWKGYAPRALTVDRHCILLLPANTNFDFDKNDDNEFLPGLYYLNSGKHTKGHLMFILKDGLRYICFIGDEDKNGLKNGSLFAAKFTSFENSNSCVIVGNHDMLAVEKLKEFLRVDNN
ncbi:MAG: MBL fold metallo-hydrolase [Bacteroidetes bacterium]|nr:MBL fold metallo-hydrolase [Bacteroidota bacterium]